MDPLISMKNVLSLKRALTRASPISSSAGCLKQRDPQPENEARRVETSAGVLRLHSSTFFVMGVQGVLVLDGVLGLNFSNISFSTEGIGGIVFAMLCVFFL